MLYLSDNNGFESTGYDFLAMGSQEFVAQQVLSSPLGCSSSLRDPMGASGVPRSGYGSLSPILGGFTTVFGANPCSEASPQAVGASAHGSGDLPPQHLGVLPTPAMRNFRER